MKVIIITEERLEELVEKCLTNCFRGPDASKMEESVSHRTVNYHLCDLKREIKDGKLGL